MLNEVTLYHYWRSSASWRARWALAFKGIKPKLVAVNLLEGETESAAHLARNPMGYVPVLAVAGRHMVESTAILEFLEEQIPAPQLLPGDAFDRQHVRALCEIVNAGTQPLHNLNVNEFLSDDLEVRKRWNQHWIRKGLGAFQTLAAPRAGKFVFGDRVTAADLFLVPQCYAAARFEVDVAREFPLLARWNAAGLETRECQESHPERFKP